MTSPRPLAAVPPIAADAALAALCWLVFTLPVALGLRLDNPAWQVALLGALAVAPLAVRRQHPVGTALAVAAVLIGCEIAGVRFTPFVSNAGPAFGIAIYSLAARVRRRVSLPLAAGLGAAAWAVTGIAFALHNGQDHDAVQLIIAVPAWIVGELVRLRRNDATLLVDERRRQAAEHDARVRAEERLRLSRDVHDIVSHNLSAIAVQAGVARMLIAEQPRQGADALAAIESTSRAALDELRTLLREIREPGADNPGPAANLAQLPQIVERLRSGGLDVGYRVEGDAHRADAYGEAVQTAAVRIAQEALTNVVKHADARSATLTVTHHGDELIVTVVDDGRRPPTDPTPGIGLTGMRERAELLGGTLAAGPQPSGGFGVTARLPVRSS